MDVALEGLILFWALTAAGVLAVAFAVATRRLNPLELLTPREWSTAAKIVGILLMTLAIIYFHNTFRYAGKDFIYGRF